MTAYSKTLTLTRTADANAYTAGDVIGSSTSSGGAVLTFDGFGPASDIRLMLTSARLLWEVSSIPSGATSFRLHLYNGSPASALADNAAWDLGSADWTAYKGYIDLGTPVDVGSACFVQADILNHMFGINTGNIYGYLVTNGGYTPGSADKMLITLEAVQV